MTFFEKMDTTDDPLRKRISRSPSKQVPIRWYSGDTSWGDVKRPNSPAIRLFFLKKRTPLTTFKVTNFKKPSKQVTNKFFLDTLPDMILNDWFLQQKDFFFGKTDATYNPLREWISRMKPIKTSTNTTTVFEKTDATYEPLGARILRSPSKWWVPIQK